MVYNIKNTKSIKSYVGVVVVTLGSSNAKTIELAIITVKAIASKTQLVIMINAQCEIIC